MKVPYARKWQQETEKLAELALGCKLSEEKKWGKRCFTYQKKNVVIVIPLKDGPPPCPRNSSLPAQPPEKRSW